MEEPVTRVEIRGAPAAVRDVLADLAAYPEWNPFIRKIAGMPQPGSRLEVVIRPPERQPMTFRPTVLRATPDVELRWPGRLVDGVSSGFTSTASPVATAP